MAAPLTSCDGTRLSAGRKARSRGGGVQTTSETSASLSSHRACPGRGRVRRGSPRPGGRRRRRRKPVRRPGSEPGGAGEVEFVEADFAGRGRRPARPPTHGDIAAARRGRGQRRLRADAGCGFHHQSRRRAVRRRGRTRRGRGDCAPSAFGFCCVAEPAENGHRRPVERRLEARPVGVVVELRRHPAVAARQCGRRPRRWRGRGWIGTDHRAGAQALSVPPVALVTSATTFWPTASISSSVSVRSLGCSVTSMASDFLPGPSASLSKRSKTSTPR